ncbi:hypothetical protein ABH979_002428 [Bradyrhizobium ottawaense]
MGDAGVERDEDRDRRGDGCGRPHHGNDCRVRAALREEAGNAEADGEDRGHHQMQRHGAVDRGRSDTGHRAARQHQHVGIGAHRPFGEHDEDGRCRRAERAGGRRCTPGDEKRRANEKRERDQGQIRMCARQYDQHGAEQVGAERARRDRLDLAVLDAGAEHEAADDEQRGEHEACDDVEGMRRDLQLFAIQTREDPEHGKGDRRDREPAPQPDAREAEARGGDDGEIDVERPVVRLAAGDEERRHEGADHAEAGQRRPMQQRRGERAHGHDAEQHEGGRGHEEAVERIGGIDGRERHRRTRGGENRRDVGDRQRLDVGNALLAPRPLAGPEQRSCEQATQEHAHAGAEQAGLDRIAHHEEAAERERKAADPHHPAGAELLLEAGRSGRHGRWCGSRRARFERRR